ncbi:MAG: glycosyltransferase family 2 protein [Filimonas sp.]|nr:glycosyltransferase family 2 protein [Filimonas sp.]
MKNIGIVSVLFNSEDVIEEFFESISLQSHQEFIIYLIDNSYKETTTKLILTLAAKFNLVSKVNHIINDVNVGVAKGNNQGIQLALQDECEYILLANNDIVFRQKDLFIELIAKSEKQKMVAPQVLYYGTNLIWYAGGAIDKYKAIAVHDNEFKDASAIPSQEGITEYAPTCFLLIHKDVFKKVGLMDEKYFVYWDDVDFIYRANKMGFRVLYVPEYIIEHKVSVSTGGSTSDFSIYYSLRNRIYFIKKHFAGVAYVSSMAYTYFTNTIKFLIQKSKRKAISKAFRDAKEMIIDTTA